MLLYFFAAGVVVRKETRKIDRLTGNRRGTDKEREYEVEWVGLPTSQNSFVPRKILEKNGNGDNCLF